MKQAVLTGGKASASAKVCGNSHIEKQNVAQESGVAVPRGK